MFINSTSVTSGLIAATISLALAASSPAQPSANFVSVGQLPGYTTSKCLAISPDGAVAVGEAGNGTTTQAFLWTAANGIRGLGFMSSNQKSVANDVAVDSQGIIHITGTALNSNNKDQAFYWVGDPLGTGTFTAIPFLSGGSTSKGNGLRIRGDVIYIVGESEKSGGIIHAFRWRSSDQDLEDLGDIPAGADNSIGEDIGFSGTSHVVVGKSQSNWFVSGTGDRQEAFRWNSGEVDLGMLGIRGLDYVCGRGFQVAAGPNGVAETSADTGDIQVVAVGTDSLDPSTVIVSSGQDRWLQTAHAGYSIQGDDLLWPVGQDADGQSQSRARAVSANARFTVGRSTYPSPGANPRLWQATLHDTQVRDKDPGGNHCGGPPLQFGLGFLDDDNYSEALDVSMPTVPDGAPAYRREGMVVVGWSIWLKPDEQAVRTVSRAMISFIHDSYDVFGINYETANLKTYLTDNGASLSGWGDLRQATGVSDNGNIVVGWGLNGTATEGFVATLLPASGACCACQANQGCSCTVTTMDDCTNNLGGTYQGDQTTCSLVVCCPTPFADADADGDVDQVDFGLFQACLTAFPGEGLRTGCECFDQDSGGQGDGDIDSDDWGAFESQATGTGI